MTTSNSAIPTRFQQFRWITAAFLVIAAGACCATAARGDRLRILHENSEGVQARIDLVQQARHEINVSYYIVGDDEVPLAFLSLLRDAARHGLTVRLIVDGQGSDNLMPRALEAHLIREGVQIKEFHPRTPGHLLWVMHRMHDKLLIVDGEHLITGGRNLKDEYFGLDCINFVDRDVYLRGCAAAAAQCYFLARWESGNVCSTRLSGRINQKKLEKDMAHP
jgi:cardiolipin synthase C